MRLFWHENVGPWRLGSENKSKTRLPAAALRDSGSGHLGASSRSPGPPGSLHGAGPQQRYFVSSLVTLMAQTHFLAAFRWKLSARRHAL